MLMPVMASILVLALISKADTDNLHISILRGFKIIGRRFARNFNLLYILKEMAWGGPRRQNFEGGLKIGSEKGASK